MLAIAETQFAANSGRPKIWPAQDTPLSKRRLGSLSRGIDQVIWEEQMSRTVSELLVGVLEQIGVTQIFGLIGDSLNPLADAVRKSKIEWVGVRHEEGAALAAAGQAKLTGRLGVCAGTTGPGSTHLWRGSTRRAAITHPSLHCPVTCRGRCTAPTLSRRPSRICCFEMSRFIPRRSHRRRRQRP